MQWVGDFRYDPNQGVVFQEDGEVKLTPRTRDVLNHLLDHANETVSSDELLDTYWRGSFSADNAVQKAVSEIRQAFGDTPRKADYVKTIAKKGYMFVAPIRPVSETPPTVVTKQAASTYDDGSRPAAYHGQDPYVFICYSHADKKAVYDDLYFLRASGVPFWYDEGISPGSIWRAELADRITRSGTFVFFVSKASLASPHCLREVDLALDCGIRVLPVFLEDCELPGRIRIGLGSIQAINRHLVARTEYQDRLSTVLAEFTDPAFDASNPPPSILPPGNTARSHGLVAGVFGIVLIAIAGGVYWWNVAHRGDPVAQSAQVTFAQGSQPRAIAVLPFDDLSADAGSLMLAAGMHEDILSHLYTVGELVVISNRSVQRYKDNRKTIAAIGEELNVSHVLEGSVRRSGDNIRVTVRLIDAATEQQLWSKTYDRTMNDLFVIQSEIAMSVSQQLAIKLSEEVKDRMGRVPTDNLEAYQLMERARSEADNEVAREMIAQVLELDPDYNNGEAEYQYIQRLRESPDWVNYKDEITVRSERLAERYPDEPYILRNLARWLVQQGRTSPADLARQESLMRRAIELAPGDPFLMPELALTFYLAGQGNEALKVMRRWQRSNPGVIDPLTPLLELNFEPDPEYATHAAEQILANEWGSPRNVVPFYMLANDYQKVLELLSLPHHTRDYIEAKEMLILQLLDLDLDAAAAWLDWLEERRPFNEYRVYYLMVQRDPERLEQYLDDWREAQPQAIEPELYGIGLDELRARLADSEAVRRALKEQAFQKSMARINRLPESERFRIRQSEGTWSSLSFVINAMPINPIAAARMLEGMDDYYARGGTHWYIADRFVIQGLMAAIRGDLVSAIELLHRAEQYGYRKLFSLETVGVFDDRENVLNGLTRLEEFASLIDRIEMANAEATSLARASIPQMFEPGCYRSVDLLAYTARSCPHELLASESGN